MMLMRGSGSRRLLLPSSSSLRQHGPRYLQRHGNLSTSSTRSASASASARMHSTHAYSNASTSSSSSSSPLFSSRFLSLLAAGGFSFAALSYSLSANPAVCDPLAAPLLVPTPTADRTQPSSSDQPTEHSTFIQTSSRLKLLPQSLEELSKASLEELAGIYDPTQVSTTKNLAHGIMWGAPTPPPTGMDPLPLLYTADDPDPFHRHLELLMRTAQDRICSDLIDVELLSRDAAATATLETLDGQTLTDAQRSFLLNQSAPGSIGFFQQHVLRRPNNGGGGIERVLSGGRTFSKAGVNISISRAKLPRATWDRLVEDHPSMRAPGITPPEPHETTPLFTASLSLVLHAVSPHVPTVHANYRYFELTLKDGKKIWWFGGGADLTPTYVVPSDARFFHAQYKAKLDTFDKNYYPTCKKWCDQYFRNRHRNECRGVGGIFFDDLHTRDRDHYDQLISSMLHGFSAAYFPIVLKNKSKKFDESDLEFQQLRRGRYVEFNLYYDKGTLWGLKMPNVRADAVLMSLPPIVRFAYRQKFEGADQEYTKEVLTNPKEWV